jgi:ABC-2 type transport system permease protein
VGAYVRRNATSFTAMALAMMTYQCGSSPITANRIEGAMGPTFANLVYLELTKLELPTPPASAIRVNATCHKIGAAGGSDGPGEWSCTLVWTVPGARGSLRDVYGLRVSSDGCYTATTEGLEGKEAHMGGPTLVTKTGARITNLLYVFEGCFDTT